MNNQKDLISKLDQLSSGKKSGWLKDADYRRANKGWLKKSQLTAIKILRALREQGRSQKDLAEQLHVSPQQVNKWVKGKENFTYETVAKIEEALNIRITNINGEAAQEQVVTTTQQKYEYSRYRYSAAHYQRAEIKKKGIMSPYLDLSKLPLPPDSPVLKAA